MSFWLKILHDLSSATIAFQDALGHGQLIVKNLPCPESTECRLILSSEAQKNFA